MRRALMISALLIVGLGCRSIGTPTASAPAAPPAVTTVDADAIVAQATLSEADLLALVYAHPRVIAASRQAEAAAGLAWQRELRPNPSVGLEIEDLALDDMDPGSSTTWIGYSQPWVVGERLQTARSLGEAEVAVGSGAVDVLVHELQGQVRLAYGEMAYLDRRRDLLGELSAEVDEVRLLLENRIAGGAAAESEMARVVLVVESMQAQRQQAAVQLRVQQLRLQQWLGRRDIEPDKLELAFQPASALLGQVEIGEHPRLRQARRRVLVARGQVAHEQALAVPDVDVGVAVGRNHGDDENVVELGVSIPLAVFDRRQGAIQAAEAELAAAEATVAAIEAELAVAVASVQAEIAGHRDALAAHDARIAPVAEAGYSQAVERFRAGKVSLLELLDAVRSRAEARLHRLELVNAVNRSAVELHNLTTYPTP